MSIIPVLKFRELIAVLLKAGFRIVRQTGSHVILRHSYDVTRHTVVPFHNKDIPRFLLTRILKQAKITVQQFLKLLQ